MLEALFQHLRLEVPRHLKSEADEIWKIRLFVRDTRNLPGRLLSGALPEKAEPCVVPDAHPCRK